MEKFCPACSRVYNDDVALCEVDGERLVLLNEEPSLVGHVLDGKYTLISKLGEGGMGSVYLAEQATMGREVAIKVLRREFSQNRTAIKRFLREARAASKLAHPNTITVYDFGQSNDGLLYLVMERLSGRPLADILDQDGVLGIQRAAHIFGQICDSLAEAHRQGITHRDLKPENIFIEQKVGNDDFVKVLDFGIAKMQGDDATGQATATGMICGTPSYMSPEQAMGKEIDGRSDIYALGVLLYEMLTNEKPFEGDTPMEVMLKHINEPPPDIYHRTAVRVPTGVQDTIERLLSKKADQRPPDCQAAKKMLLESLSTPLIGPVLSTSDPSISAKRRVDTQERVQSLEKTGLSHTMPASGFTAPPARSNRRWWWWGVAALVLGAVGGLLAAVVPGAPAPAATLAGEGQGAAGTPTAPRAGGPGVIEEVPGPARTAPDADDRGDRSGGTPASVEAGSSATNTPGAEVGEGVGRRIGEVLSEVPLEATANSVAATNVGTAVEEPGGGGEGAPGDPERSDAQQQVAAVGAEGAPEPVRARVRVEVVTVPEGAQVFEGDALLGAAPLTFERDKDSGTVKLTIRARGYRTHHTEVGTAGDVSTRIELKRANPGATQAREPGAKEPNKPGFGGTF